MNTNKYCVWMITGGTTHALCCLSACMKYAIKSGRQILPFSETHPYYETQFYSFYRINEKSQLARHFVKSDEYEHIRDMYIPPYKTIPKSLMETRIDGPKPDEKEIRGIT